MLHVVLYQPEIAGNAGSVARTCSALGATLHLVRPLGFRLRDPGVRRAGMDYLEGVTIVEHASWRAYRETHADARTWALSGSGARAYSSVSFAPGDHLLLGPESSGLPPEVLAVFPTLRIPMPGGGRSLNLAVAAGIVAYEAARQLTGGWADLG